MTLLHDYTVSCPYCGESFFTMIDCSAGSQTYIEDCQICCQPIVFEILLDHIDETPIIVIKRDNE